MKLFVYEHITSGALAGQELPHSLADEGDLMLTAILQDLASHPQLELIILRDSRLTKINLPSGSPLCKVLWVDNNKHFTPQWEKALAYADTSFVIAPETNGQLEKTQQDILNSGSSYLGSSQSVSQLCTNKLKCYARLTSSNISTAPTEVASQWEPSKLECTGAVVIKPIDGAGCLNTLFFEHQSQAQNYLQNGSSLDLSTLIVQPYIEGVAASLSLFISDKTVTVLNINRQLISQQQSELIFRGTEANTIQADEFPKNHAQEFAEEIYKTFPGLWGFVGVDFVLSPSGPVLIEINPRLTTSYISLKSVLNFNPTDLLIEHMEEKLKQSAALYD